MEIKEELSLDPFPYTPYCVLCLTLGAENKLEIKIIVSALIIFTVLWESRRWLNTHTSQTNKYHFGTVLSVMKEENDAMYAYNSEAWHN